MRLLFAQQRFNGLDASLPSAASDQTGPGTGADESVPRRITCLHVIREDYEGTGLSYPSRLFVDSVKREIYVTDSGHSRILVYTHDFYPLLTIGKSDGIEAPVAVAVDSEGYVYVAQSPGRTHPRARISEFSPSLTWKRDILFAGFEGADSFRPRDIAINRAGALYVAGNGYPGVVVLDRGGAFSHVLSPMDRLGKEQEQKATICGMEIDDAGKIYLLSEEMGRVYVYDDNETYLFKFGKKGGSSGKLSRPRGLAVDSHNKAIYVIDYMRHTATAYTHTGRFLFEFGGKGWGRGWFQYPSDIAVDTAGNVVVADTFNNRVQVLAMQGVPSVERGKQQARHASVGTKEPAVQRPKKHYVLTANMNLREKASTESRIIGLMKKGEEFEITDKDRHDNLTSWYYIITESGLTGWFCGVYRGRVMFVKKEGMRGGHEGDN